MARTPVEFIDHDYTTGTMDSVLAAIRKTIPFSEWRHKKYFDLAHYGNLIPGLGFQDEEPLHRVITFPDKSNSLYLGAPIILPAGACKYGEYIPDIAKMGFGGVTVGTATGKKRAGNPHNPRVATIEKDRAINNSMGLNNPGIDALVKEVDAALGLAHKQKLSVGLSVAESPEIQDHDERLEDLLTTFRKAYNIADYVEINVSCPNTGNKRVDADTSFIEDLFQGVMKMRSEIPVRRAVYAKISPDMGEGQLRQTLDILDELGVNGLVLFNTFPGARMEFLDMQTPQDKVKVVTEDGGIGGLSGRILYKNTFKAVDYIKTNYPRFSIMASGGVDHGAKAWDLLRLGADAVQSYSVVAFRWNAIHKMRQELLACLRETDCTSIDEYLEKNPLKRS